MTRHREQRQAGRFGSYRDVDRADPPVLPLLAIARVEHNVASRCAAIDRQRQRKRLILGEIGEADASRRGQARGGQPVD